MKEKLRVVIERYESLPGLNVDSIREMRKYSFFKGQWELAKELLSELETKPTPQDDLLLYPIIEKRRDELQDMLLDLKSVSEVWGYMETGMIQQVIQLILKELDRFLDLTEEGPIAKQKKWNKDMAELYRKATEEKK